jgi:hypothetical protein
LVIASISQIAPHQVKGKMARSKGFIRRPAFAIRALPHAGRRSSVVERIIGNAEVGSSILPGGTILGTNKNNWLG